MIPQNQRQQSGNQSLEQLLATGQELHDRFQFQEALKYFEYIIAKEPKNVLALSCKGSCLCNMNRLPEGMEYINKSLLIDPDNEISHIIKANQLILQGKYQEAYQLHQKLLYKNPKCLAACLGLSKICIEIQRFAECLIWCEKAIKIDPQFSLIYINKGAALAQLNRTQEALQALSIAERLNGSHPLIYINKSFCLTLMKQFKEAIVQCDKSISLNPNIAFGYSNKANALLYLNNLQESFNYAQHANKLDSKIPQPYIIMGLILLRQKSFDQALAICNQGLTYSPKNKNILSIKRQALKSMNKQNEVKQLEQQFKQEFPTEQLQDLIEFFGDVGNVIQNVSNNSNNNSSGLGWQLLDLMLR